MIIDPSSGDICLITCTRDRPLLFALCERWMRAQAWPGRAQWIVVDDGDYPARATCGQKYVRMPPSKGKMTLAGNLLAALPLAQAGAVLFVEDDDYYGPRYVGAMADLLREKELVGQKCSPQYHLSEKKWRYVDNPSHSPLSMTGVAASRFADFRAACAFCGQHNDIYIDIRLWKSNIENRHLLQGDDAPLSVGIKGAAGRQGASGDHAVRSYANADPDFKKLREWAGADSMVYENLRTYRA